MEEDIMANKQIFRDSYKEYATSPEELNTYLSKTKPKVWAFLALIAIFLGLFVFWAIFGTIPNVIECGCEVEADGTAFVVISSDDVQSLNSSSEFNNNEVYYKITGLTATPELAPSSVDRLALYYSGIQDGQSFYRASIQNPNLQPGIYQGKISITPDIPPYKILFN